MEKNIPKAWGSGPINLNGVEIDCAVLDDGTPILNKGKMMKALGRPWKGSSRTDKPSFIGAMNLEPFIRPELAEMLNGVQFYNNGRLSVIIGVKQKSN